MSVNQVHLGNGDNIGNDKIVNNIQNQYNYNREILDAINVNQVVRDVMLICITGSFKEAKDKLSSYQVLYNTIEEVGRLFGILMMYIDSLENESLMLMDRLKLELANQSSTYIEIYRYILIKKLAQGNIDSALKVYSSFSDDAGYYLLAAYDQYFANEAELSIKLDNELYILDDYQLFYLAQGFIRLNEHQNAALVLNQISSINQTINIQYWIIAAELNSIIFSYEEPFSYIHRDVSRKIECIADRFLSIISNKQVLEPLAVNILIGLAKISMSTISLPEIQFASLKFQSDISKADKDMGDALREIKDKEPFFISDTILSKLKLNGSLNENEINHLIRAIFHNNVDLSLLKSWLDNCNEIIICDDLDSKVVKYILLSFIKFESEIEKNEYRVLINKFLEEESKLLKELSPYIVKAWCDNLFSLGKAFEITVYRILNLLCKDLSVNSELNLYYLQSLLRLDQLDTLSKELSKVADDEWSHDLYLFKARYLLKSDDYDQAQVAYNKFIDKEKDLYVWHEYLISCMYSSEGINLARKQLSRIPRSLLSIESNGYEFFLFQVGFFIDFDFIESILVNSFILSPYENAPIIAKFYLNSFSSKVDNNFDESKSFEGVYGGVAYELDGKENLKLLVDSDLANHKDLISIQSELGKRLNTLEVKSEFQNYLGAVKLLRRESISATVYNLAMQIVEESQHNYDEPLFRRIKMKENDPVNSLIESLQLMTKDNSIENKIEDFLRESNLPLYIKGMKVSKSNNINKEVDIVYALLLNEYANQCLNKTYTDVIEFDSIVIDIYGAVYLCITNLYKALITSGISVYISQETVKVIELWIQEITDEDFLRLNEYNSKFSLIDSKDIHHIHGELIYALQELLDNTIVEQPKEFDLPIIVSEIRTLDLISSSVFSSVKLALSHNIPWLCLDSVIGGFIKNSTECKLASFHHLILTLIDEKYLTYNDRKKPLKYMAFNGLYFSYYLTDLIELSKDIDGLPILTNLLNNTNIEFHSSETAITLLTCLIKNIIPIGFYKKNNIY